MTVFRVLQSSIDQFHGSNIALSSCIFELMSVLTTELWLIAARDENLILVSIVILTLHTRYEMFFEGQLYAHCVG